MSDVTCQLDDCSKSRYQNKRYCGSHYMKWWRYGDPYFVAPKASFRDITGQRFGQLTAVRREHGMWICRCDCGNEKPVRIGDLRNSNIITCGERPTHPKKQIITYAGAHDRVRAVKGRASTHQCIDCGRQAHEWSYDHTDPAALHEEQGEYLVPYSLSPDHYQPRCITCHRRFDKGTAAQPGSPAGELITGHTARPGG